MRGSTLFILPLIGGLAGGFGGPPVAHALHAWIYPTPEQAAARAKADAEWRVAEQERARLEVERRASGVNGNLAARHPGCSFDDLGSYESGDLIRHPILAIFCPGQTVTVNTSTHVTEGKHSYERPESTITDTPTEETPQ